MPCEQKPKDITPKQVETIPNLIAEDDTTDIKMVPIEVTDDNSAVLLEGMFFDNPSGWTDDSEPETDLVIEKDKLDRSSGFIIGRFYYELSARAKIVYRVFLDGKKVDDYGTGLPWTVWEGEYDTILFKYPNSAKANKDGKHKVRVEYGLITGIAESQLGLLDWGKVKSQDFAEFTITLLKHKNMD